MDDFVSFEEEPEPPLTAVPASPSVSVTDDELATTVRVLRALATANGGPSAEFREPRCKPLREAIQLYVDDVRARLFHGQGADKYTRRKENKRAATAKQQQERAMDRAAAEKTQMRAERLRMLADLEQQAEGSGAALTFVPDGAVESAGASAASITYEAGAAGASGGDGRGDGGGDGRGDGGGGGDAGTADGATAGETELLTLRACYTCKKRYRTLHHFYAQLCPECAALNFQKRQQTAALEGRCFLLTGARVKIGFQVGGRRVPPQSRTSLEHLITHRAPARFPARPPNLPPDLPPDLRRASSCSDAVRPCWRPPASPRTRPHATPRSLTPPTGWRACACTPSHDLP